LQEQASNHLKLLWSKAMVVSVEEKSRQRIVAGEDHGDEHKRTIRLGVETKEMVSKLVFFLGSRISTGGTCFLPVWHPA
jgi:hypothetical protein